MSGIKANIEDLSRQLNMAAQDMAFETANPGAPSRTKADSVFADIAFDVAVTAMTGGMQFGGVSVAQSLDALNVYDTAISEGLSPRKPMQQAPQPRKFQLGQRRALSPQFKGPTLATLGRAKRIEQEMQAAMTYAQKLQPRQYAALPMPRLAA